MRVFGFLLGLSVSLLCGRAIADDLADEADLHFENGAKAYQRGDFATALDRFLLSNRLVPNRNVVYNVARCYEQLERFPEAFRYYDQALLGETDPKVVAAIERELERIGKRVSVLRLTSTPPGATIYIDRRDLGPRGVTPRRLALKPGSYQVIAELNGYKPAHAEIGNLQLGESKELTLALEPLLGRVAIAGNPGIQVIADSQATGPRCTSPCELVLPLGTHQLFLSQSGYQSQQISIEATEAKVNRIEPRLEQQMGGIVVSTDEPNALIEIDGKPKGFTPGIVEVPAGSHSLRISLDGFQTVERAVEVRPDEQIKVNLELIQVEVVEGAARRVESVENTASSVSIVPHAEITAMAYPTLAEALRGLPGVYFWDDRAYVGIGMRGLGRLGGYGTRMLVLSDGVATNDNWLGSSYVGYDVMTDLADVERVELVRGPGSAVYGTGAFSGVINVITRRETSTGAEAGVSTNLDGVARARIRGNLRLSANSGVYASAAIARSAGRDFYLPEVARVRPSAGTPDALSDWSRGLDGMQSATLRGRAHHGVFSMQWSWHRIEKQLPNAPFDTTFGDPKTMQRDERAFIELRAEPRLSRHTATVSSVVLNRYQFTGKYARPFELALDPASDPARNTGLQVDGFRGHWVTLSERVVQEFGENLALTMGAEGSWHLDVLQTGSNALGKFLDDPRTYRVLAGYAILDARLHRRLRVSFGGRLDNYDTFGSSLNPRIGVVAKPYERGNTKLTVGRAFRAPSIYELYYNDRGVTQVANSDLKPETMLSAEIEHTHRFTPTVIGSLAVYANYVRGLISGVSDDAFGGALQYRSMSSPIAAIGTEIGLRREWRSGWMASAYYGYTQTRFLKDNYLSSLLSFSRDPSVRHVANSPVHAATFKGVAPFLLRGTTIGTRVTLEDGRWDRFEKTSDPEAQQKSRAAVIWDLVLTAEDPRHHLRLSLGVYNLFDWRYQYPVGIDSAPLRGMPSYGRTALASLETRF